MRNLLLFISILFMIFFFSCKKKDFDSIEKNNYSEAAAAKPNNLAALISGGTCIEDLYDPSDYDSILKPTILGYHLINHPYSLANMQTAYLNLYGSASGVTVTNKYVRFKPSNPQQLSTLEDLDIDLFDYPLDYDVMQQGDYYNDGVTPTEEIPWLYAIVDVGFTPPAGITYEVLEQIHIPTLAAVENEAFRITGNPFDDYNCGGSLPAQTQSSDFECAPDYHWDASLNRCVRNAPLPPPPPTPTRQPSGRITVTDNNNGVETFRGVRNARVTAKRFFKVERTFTNNNGEFFLNKEFNKVHLFVEFENDQASIRSLRMARLWQMLSPVERDFGVKGDLNNLNFNIDFEPDALSRMARYWAAATAHNAIQEYRDFASLQGIGTPPDKIKILLTNWEGQGSGGAAPMFAKRALGAPSDFVTNFIISDLSQVAGGLSALLLYLEAQVDITAGYNLGLGVTVRSDRLSETMFHEQTHAAHFNKVGNTWWSDFVSAELHEMTIGPSPYGSGNNGYSPIIALGESWAYHIGHFATDWKYPVGTGSTFEQGFEYTNGDIREMGTVVAFTGLNAHLNLLEDFNSKRLYDDFHWIPQGLYYDLMDDRNDVGFGRVLLDDQVTGYSNQQFFNSLDNDITTLQDYRVRLLSENGNNQAAGVTTIFDFYVN